MGTSVWSAGRGSGGWCRPQLAVTIVLAALAAACSSAIPGSTDLPMQSGSPSPSAIASADATPSATPVATPDATPVEPGVSPSPGPTSVAAVQLPAGLAAMTITSDLNFRSQPIVRDDTLLAVLANRAGLQIIEGPELAGGYWWYRVSTSIDGEHREGWVASADVDGAPWIGPAPEACVGFELPQGEVSVATLSELQSGMPGTWAGCVTTPWVPPYWVTLTFRDDGTYSGVAMVGPTGERQPAFYHGSDADSPNKRYAINDLQDSLNGVGQIDIVFDTGSVNRGDLRNIRLMGDVLAFEFFHQSVYGPIAFELYRIMVSD